MGARVGRLMLGLALALVTTSAHAQSRCTAAKLDAGGVLFDAAARCEAKAFGNGSPMDPLCLDRATARFLKRFEKAERKADYLTQGDAAATQALIEGALPAAGILDPFGAVCCATPSGICLQTFSEGECQVLSGAPGAAGSVCDASGACVEPAAAASGSCCQGSSTLIGVTCAAGAVSEEACTSTLGRFAAGAVCGSDRYCVAPGASPESRCAAAKLKAMGRYVGAVAGCEAKGAAAGQSADPACIERARAKLERGFAGAEEKSDCARRGEGTATQAALDDVLGELFELIRPVAN